MTRAAVAEVPRWERLQQAARIGQALTSSAYPAER
jgi:hypothetical protein